MFLCISNALLMIPGPAAESFPGGANLRAEEPTEPFGARAGADISLREGSGPPAASLSFRPGPFLRAAKPPPLPGPRAPGGRPGAGLKPSGTRKAPAPPAPAWSGAAGSFGTLCPFSTGIAGDGDLDDVDATRFAL